MSCHRNHAPWEGGVAGSVELAGSLQLYRLRQDGGFQLTHEVNAVTSKEAATVRREHGALGLWRSATAGGCEMILTSDPALLAQFRAWRACL